MESQIDINTCTNACTHSTQGVGQCRVTGTHTQCHTEEPMLRDWSPNHCRPPRLPNLRKKGAWGCPNLPRSPPPSVAGVDVIKHCDCSRWYEKIPPGGETSIWRWDLQLELQPPIGVEPSIWQSDLQSGVRFWLEMRPPFRSETFNHRWDLHFEVRPPFRGRLSF